MHEKLKSQIHSKTYNFYMYLRYIVGKINRISEKNKQSNLHACLPYS